MRYISIFSGIEAASVAWEPLGWEPVAFAEVDKFPSATDGSKQFIDNQSVDGGRLVLWREPDGE